MRTLWIAGLVMAVSLALTGSGTVGDIQAGWTFDEPITPVAPGDTSGEVGGINLSVGQGIDSEFVIDNASVFTHAKDDGTAGLGAVTGKVDTLNSMGGSEDSDTTLGMTLTTALTKFNVDRTAPPIWRVDSAPADFVEYGTGTGQVINSYGIATSPIDGSVYITSGGDVSSGGRNAVIKFTKDGAYVTEWGLVTGSGNGQFAAGAGEGPTGIAVSPVDGSVWVADMGNRRIQKFTSAGVYSAQTGSAGTGNGQFNSTLPANLVVDSSGNVYVTDRSNLRIQKFNSSGTYQAQVAVAGGTWILQSTPYDLAIDTGNNIYASYIADAIPTTVPVIKKYNSSLTYQSDIPFTGTATPGTPYGASFIDIDENNNLWIAPIATNYISRVNLTTGAEIERYYSGFGYSTNPNDLYNMSYNAFNDTMYVYSKSRPIPLGNFYGTTKRVQAFSYKSITLSAAIQQYVNLVDSSYTVSYLASSNPDVIFPGWSGNVWKQLKDLATAYGIEFTVVNNVITVRDIGAATLDITEIVQGTPRWSLDSTPNGQYITAINYHTTGGSGTVYNASDDGRIFTVAVGQTITETVTGPVYPESINTPTQTDSITVLPGQYYVIGSDNLPVTAAQWLAYGASVTATISTTVPGGIDVTVVGPNASVAGITQFSLAISDGTNIRPAFSITGSGVFTVPEKITLPTGADDTKNPRLIAADIDNIFLGTIERLYDRCQWSISDASGPAQSVTLEIPTSAIASFGNVGGRIVTFKHGKWRVAAAKIGNATTSLTLYPYTTTGDIDTLWLGQTTAQWDALWGSNATEDVKIKPLRTA